MLLTKRVVYWLLIASRGGANRAKILSLLKKQPKNMKQIADELHLDYKTVQHHIGIMLEHGLLETTGQGYGKIYFVSQNMEAFWSEFGEYLKKIG